MRRKANPCLMFCAAHARCGTLAALLLCSGWAVASEPAPAARYRIEQPAQPLADSLLSIARQTGASVLFDPAAVRGVQAKAVSGELSAAEAIAKLVQGSGLVLELRPSGAIVVKAAPPPAAGGGASAVRAPAPGGGDAPGAEASTVDVPVRQAQGALPGASGAGRVPEAQRPAPQRIEVTGSRLRRIAAEGPLPVNVYSRADIERSGQPTLERFLSTLNEAPMSPGEGSSGITVGQGSVQLRGLPLGSTLVLVNGRRLQAVGSSAANYFNLNLIPMAAVERVEVLPVGSSAVYGGDALAGVVNVILKKSLDGQSLALSGSKGRGFDEQAVSLATGGSDEQGAFLVLGAYTRRTPLRMGDRAFFQDWDFRTLGGPDARSRNCTPGTVSSTTTANLPGFSASFAAIPQAPAGRSLSAADFAATAGQANLCTSLANGHGQALTFGTETFSLHGVAQRRVFDNLTLFGEATLANDRMQATENGLLLSNVLVPASNAYNPFGVDVRVTGRLGLENGNTGIERKTRYTRLLGGLRGDLGPRWDWELSLSTSRDDGTRLQFNDVVNTAARTAALAASSPTLALNPFTTGRAASDEVLRSIWADGVRQNHGRKDQASAFVRGQAWELPAGPVDVIAGAEWARDRFEVLQTTLTSDERSSHALFGEVRLPLLRGGGEGVRPWNLATLTLAARRDGYSDFGSASTYQAGLELRPAASWLLRAATATSFKPPTLLQTNVSDQVLPIGGYGLLDPARGNALITSGEVLRTTNRQLTPEQGEAYALGGVWEPEPGSRLGVTAWSVRLSGVITLLAPQVLLNNEALFPGFVTRQPAVNGVPGAVTRLVATEVNFGRVATSGLDFEASQSWRAVGGLWTGTTQLTRTRQYDVVIAPGRPVEDRAGRRAADYWAPTWKGRVAVGYERPSWGLGLSSRYLGSYLDSGTSTRRLGGFWVHDLSGRVDLKALGVVPALEAVKAAALSLTVVNAGNRLPQFVATTPFFDVTQADWRGRYLSARLSVDW